MRQIFYSSFSLFLVCDISNCSYTWCGIYPCDAIRQFICMLDHRNKTAPEAKNKKIDVDVVRCVCVHIDKLKCMKKRQQQQKNERIHTNTHWFIVDKWINYDCLIPWITFSAPESYMCVCVHARVYVRLCICNVVICMHVCYTWGENVERHRKHVLDTLSTP